jgi:thiamine pyrophosphate-dependent acetolactate synthase large subunit-like protein
MRFRPTKFEKEAPMALVGGGDLVVSAINQEGVDTIFTLCGGHVRAVYDSCLDEGIAELMVVGVLA